MTEVIGQAWIEVLGKTAQFGPQVKKDLTSGAANRAAAEAGDRFGTVVGKAVVKAMHPFGGRAADDYGKEFSRKAKDHGLGFGKLVAAGITAGLGIDSIQAVASKAFGTIRDASDLAESQSKNVAVFHESAKAVEDFAADSQRNLLLTKQSAIEASATFGNLFVSLGIANKPAADLSTKLVGLAEDLSSFNNVGTDEALEALRSGLLGEAEPLRKFGVTLSESRIQAEAFALGLAKPVKDADAIAAANVKVAAAQANLAKVQKEHGVGTVAAAQAQTTLTKANKALNDALGGQKAPLTAAQKAQAAYSIILKDTATAQGDAARTSDGFANQSRILHKNLGDLSAQIGTALLPHALDLTHKMNDLVVEFQHGTGTGGEIRDTLKDVAEVAADVGGVLQSTVVPALRFVADHPDLFKAIAESMVIYAAATKTAAFYSALIKPPPVAVPGGAGGAAGAAGKGGKVLPLAGGPVGLGIITGVVAGEVDKHLGPVGSRGYLGDTSGITEVKGKPSDYVRGPDGKLYPKGQVPPPPPRSDVVDDSVPSRRRNSQTAKGYESATKAAEDLHATQVRMRDASQKAAKTAQFEADQYAANQERQAAALEASQDAIRERAERTEAALQRQEDAIKRQITVLESSRDKILDFRRDVFGTTASFTSLTSLASDPSRATAAGIVGSLQSRVAAEKLFTKNITTLGQRGLDKGVLAELAAAGPEQRGIASALAAATPQEISALNAAEKASRAQAQALAATTTAQQFGPQALANLQRSLATQNRLLASVDARLAALPKATAQALKTNEATVKSKQRTAVTK